MRRDDLLAIVELTIGLGMLLGFLSILLVPGIIRLAAELPWLIGSPRWLPGLGIHPHWLAEARSSPSFVVLAACAGLAVCYRWLISRRRGN